MNIIKFTFIDIWRTKLFFGILFISLLIAFTSVSYLFFYGERIEKRFDYMPNIANMIVGAKTSDHKILLGSLAGVNYERGVIPYTLYKSFEDKMSVRHGDGGLTESSYIENIIPVLYIDRVDGRDIVATNNKLIPTLKDGLVVGHNVKKNISDELYIPHLGKKIKIESVHKKTDSILDEQIFIDLDYYYSLNLIPEGGTSIWGNKILHYMLASINKKSVEEFRSLVNQRTVAQVIVKDEVLIEINKLLSGEKRIIYLMANLIVFLSILSMLTIFIVLSTYKKVILKSLHLIGFSKKERALYISLELSFVIILPLIIGSYLGHYLLVMFFPSSLF